MAKSLRLWDRVVRVRPPYSNSLALNLNLELALFMWTVIMFTNFHVLSYTNYEEESGFYFKAAHSSVVIANHVVEPQRGETLLRALAQLTPIGIAPRTQFRAVPATPGTPPQTCGLDGVPSDPRCSDARRRRSIGSRKRRPSRLARRTVVVPEKSGGSISRSSP